MKLARITKFGGRLLAVILCQAFFGLLPLGSPIDAQSGGTAKTKDFAFEVVSLRESPPIFGGLGPTPNGFRVVTSIEYMIKLAYGQGWGLPNGDRMRVINLPKWADQRYQIEARVAEEDLKAWQNQSRDQELTRSAMRHILKERFHLALHEQEVLRDGYRLMVRQRGVKLKPTPAGSALPPGRPLPDGGINVPVSGSSRKTPNIQFYGTSMSGLASYLNTSSGLPIYDETKLVGRYDFILQYEEQSDAMGALVPPYDLNSLGLELKPGKGPGQDLIIDHVEKPTPN